MIGQQSEIPLIGGSPPPRFDRAMRRPSLPITVFLLATVSVDLAVVELRPNITTDAPEVSAVLLWSLYLLANHPNGHLAVAGPFDRGC
jgi:hypothetical protein